MSPRILFIDIETAPKVTYVWRVWKVNVGINQMIEDQCLLSYAAKWLEEKEVIYSDSSERHNIRDDRQLVREIHALLDEADIVVVQNGKAFDLPTIKTRMIEMGMQPFSQVKVVDTLLEARKQFNFTFNHLEYLAKRLNCKHQKLKHEKFPGFELWVECLHRNLEAWAEMKKYNIYDVLALEEVYLKMRPWIVGHPNVGVYLDNDDPVCPRCGGVHLQKRGFYRTQFNVYQQYQCKTCGGYPRGRQVLNPTKHRKLQLTN